MAGGKLMPQMGCPGLLYGYAGLCRELVSPWQEGKQCSSAGGLVIQVPVVSALGLFLVMQMSPDINKIITCRLQMATWQEGWQCYLDGPLFGQGLGLSALLFWVMKSAGVTMAGG